MAHEPKNLNLSINGNGNIQAGRDVNCPKYTTVYIWNGLSKKLIYSLMAAHYVCAAIAGVMFVDGNNKFQRQSQELAAEKAAGLQKDARILTLESQIANMGKTNENLNTLLANLTASGNSQQIDLHYIDFIKIASEPDFMKPNLKNLGETDLYLHREMQRKVRERQHLPTVSLDNYV